MKLSQEELAEKVFVSRQTVSNWENGKSYPDIHSLLLLSSLFEISLDELIKGDIELMKKEIHKNDTNMYNNYSNIFSIIFIGCLILFVPAVKYLKVFGLIMWLLVYTMGLCRKMMQKDTLIIIWQMWVYVEKNCKRPQNTRFIFIKACFRGSME